MVYDAAVVEGIPGVRLGGFGSAAFFSGNVAFARAYRCNNFLGL
jgi:hypothetical protein